MRIQLKRDTYEGEGGGVFALRKDRDSSVRGVEYGGGVNFRIFCVSSQMVCQTGSLLNWVSTINNWPY